MDAWDRLRSMFDTDDGGLYDIRLTGLDEPGLEMAFDFVRSRSSINPHSFLWHLELGRDVRVVDYPDAARLVARSVASPFHVLAQGLSFDGTVIPDLGMFLWPDEVTFDYRMGPDWGTPQLFALFELLRQVAAATGGRVGLGQHVLPHPGSLFVDEWEAYCAGSPARCDADALGDGAALFVPGTS